MINPGGLEMNINGQVSVLSVPKDGKYKQFIPGYDEEARRQVLTAISTVCDSELAGEEVFSCCHANNS